MERCPQAALGIVRELLRGSSVACDPIEAEHALAPGDRDPEVVWPPSGLQRESRRTAWR